MDSGKAIGEAGKLMGGALRSMREGDRDTGQQMPHDKFIDEFTKTQTQIPETKRKDTAPTPGTIAGGMPAQGPFDPWHGLAEALGRLAPNETDPAPTAVEFPDLYKKYKDKFDADHDGFISQNELNDIIANQDVKGKEAAFAVVLRNQVSDLEELSNDEWFDENDGINKGDIDVLCKALEKDYSDRTDDENDIIDNIDYEFGVCHRNLKEANRKLYKDENAPLESIRPEGVNQKGVGSCYFLAPMAGVAAANPELIKNMITDNNDGTYTVVFPADKENPIIVTAPTDAEVMRFTNGGEFGVWSTVLEKAYAQYLGDVDDLEGGSQHSGMRMFSNDDPDSDWLVLTSMNELHEDLTEAMKEKRGVSCNISGGILVDWGILDEKNDAGLDRAHVYSVIAYDEKTRMVTVRNPWGEGGDPVGEDGTAKDGCDDGIFTMTLDEFDSAFTTVTYQG